jgi:molybdopterin-guanine dinucleotide biosynthesis protein A
MGPAPRVDIVYDAIVLAGGGARRLGGAAKPQLQVAGATLLDRVIGAVPDAGTVVVVGPRQPAGRPVVFAREDPVGAGPVAALAAGFARTSADTIVVLAADLPWVAPAVPLLLRALPEVGVAMLVDVGGRANYLAAAWRRPSLLAALAALGEPAGASMRALVAAVAERVYVPDEGGWGQDCDTWDDLARARSRREDADA